MFRTGRVSKLLEHDPEKWIPVFPKRSCSNKKIERDDDSKKSHPALEDRRSQRRLPRPKQASLARADNTRSFSKDA